MLLDKMLGGELPTIYSKKEFHLMLREHRKHKAINPKEFKLMAAGLFFSDKKVKDIMTPRIKTFFLRYDQILTQKLLEKNPQSRAFTNPSL